MKYTLRTLSSNGLNFDPSISQILPTRFFERSNDPTSQQQLLQQQHTQTTQSYHERANHGLRSRLSSRWCWNLAYDGGRGSRVFIRTRVEKLLVECSWERLWLGTWPAQSSGILFPLFEYQYRCLWHVRTGCQLWYVI